MGLALYSVWADATPPRLLKYEIELPSGGLFPFPSDALEAALEAALKTFHVSTDVWVWFSSRYRLYPIFLTDDSNEVSRYAIAGPDGQVFRSCEMPDGLVDARIVFERLTGVDVTANDTLSASRVFLSAPASGLDSAITAPKVLSRGSIHQGTSVDVTDEDAVVEADEPTLPMPNPVTNRCMSLSREKFY
jgi:hypothetical protein